MMLVCKKRFIKIVLKQIKRNDGSSCEPVSAKEVPILVRTFLNEMMQDLPEALPWLKNVAYDLCVKCPYCLKVEKPCDNHGQFPCHDERCLCLLTVGPDGSCEYCTESHLDEFLPLPGLKRWFSSSCEDSSIKGGGGYDFLKFLSLNYLNLCFVITQYHGRSLSIEVDSTISPNIAIIQLYQGCTLDRIQPWRMSIQIAPSALRKVLVFLYLQYQDEMLYQYCQACQKLFLSSLGWVTTASYRSLSIVFVDSSWRRSEMAEFTFQKTPSIKVVTTSSQHLTTCVDVTLL